MAEPPAGEIRIETAQEAAAVDALNRLVFGGPEEALIVAGLRTAKLIALSLVAEEKGRIVGHILSPRPLPARPSWRSS